MEPDRLDALRDRTVSEALALVGERGEDGLTMRGLARRVGISTTAMYQLYESKSEIVREVRLRGLREMNEALAPAFEHGDPAERLRQMSRAYVAFARERPWLYRLLFTSAPVEINDNETDRAHISLHGVQRAIREGVELGRFRPDLDLAMTPLRLWARNHGLILLILTRKLGQPHPLLAVSDEDAFVERYVDNTVRGLLAEGQ
jgi:AcrR family transcriptional regulator